MTQHVDIIIVGAGLVGMTLAHALSGHGWQIALLDAKTLPLAETNDDRSLSLSYASQQILETLNLWSAIAIHATAINQIHISRKGLLSKTHFRNVDINLPALGYVVPAYLLAQTIAKALLSLRDVTIVAPVSIEHVEIKEKMAQVKLSNAQTLSARLIIAADGSQSSIAEQLNIYREKHAYQQTAIVTTISTDKPHESKAYERFTDQGVIALLPRNHNHFGVVWTTVESNAKKLLNLSDADYITTLKKYCSGFLGNPSSITSRSNYPLAATSIYERIRTRVVLLGNAAHTMHPIAAQGLNLALRSVAWLAETLIETSEDIGSLKTLKIYQQRTEADLYKTQTLMHGLTELTTQISAKSLWCIGLNILDKIPLCKKAFIRYATGIQGKQAKLARKLSL